MIVPVLFSEKGAIQNGAETTLKVAITDWTKLKLNKNYSSVKKN